MRAALVISAVLLAGGLVHSCPKAPSPGQESPEALVACLGDDAPASRDDAEERIVELGAAAEPFVREALLSKDTEIAARATAIMQRLAQKRKYPEWIASLPASSVQTGSWSGHRATRIEEGSLVLEDSPSLGTKMKLVCEAEVPFRLISAEWENPDSRTEGWSGSVVDGKLQVALPWPGLAPLSLDVKNVAIDAVLLRLLPLLPQRAGEIRKYDAFFIPSTLTFYRDCAVRYTGEEEIELEGQKVLSRSWELRASYRMGQRGGVLLPRIYRVVGKRVVRMEINYGARDLRVDFTPDEAR